MSTTTPVRLKRSLTLWHLIIIGIVIVQPIAPMGVYGVISNRAGGHVITTILIAMVAMLFTAISYGRMARAYPSAGSAYTYVGQEIHPALGYVTGWAMVMDYILNPLICTVLCSKLSQNVLPGVPYWPWAVFYAAFFTVLNLRGVRTSARINEALAAGMMVVVVIFFAVVGRYLLAYHQYGAGFLTQPFYNPPTFSFGGVFRGKCCESPEMPEFAWRRDILNEGFRRNRGGNERIEHTPTEGLCPGARCGLKCRSTDSGGLGDWEQIFIDFGGHQSGPEFFGPAFPELGLYVEIEEGVEKDER